MSNVKEIIAIYLRANGYDGLCNRDIPCGCGLNDFMPCDGEGGILECEPAMSGVATEDDEDGNYKKGDEIFIPIEEKEEG